MDGIHGPPRDGSLRLPQTPGRWISFSPRLAQRASAPLIFAASLAFPGMSLADGLLSGGANGLWNDFASYWLAAKLVWSGHSPYDLIALTRLGHQEGLVFQAGTGYSYPLPFAVGMVPLGWLPFGVAALFFSLLSLLVFGLSVSAWLSDRRLFRGPPRLAAGLAVLAGGYPPATGSVFFGQANLLVFGLLVLGVRLLIPPARHRIWGGVALGLAGIVKVAPLALGVPLVLAHRWRVSIGLIGSALVTTVVAVLLAPFAWSQMGRLLELGVADPYWTNQSLNGFASRLVMRTEQSVPPFPHASPALIGWGAMIGLGAATLGAMLRRRGRLADWDGFALALGMTLVAATAAAPKNSFWNHLPALVGAGLILAVPGWRQGRWLRPIGGLLAAWFGLALGQRWIDGQDDAALRSIGSASAWVSSLGLYSLVVLWLAAMLALLALPRVPVARDLTTSPAGLAGGRDGSQSE